MCLTLNQLVNKHIERDVYLYVLISVEDRKREISRRLSKEKAIEINVVNKIAIKKNKNKKQTKRMPGRKGEKLSIQKDKLGGGELGKTLYLLYTVK